MNLKAQEIYALFGTRSHFEVIVYTEPQKREVDKIVDVADMITNDAKNIIYKKLEDITNIL